eukprot:12921030-Prorocentrum_lima.AAC.1
MCIRDSATPQGGEVLFDFARDAHRETKTEINSEMAKVTHIGEKRPPDDVDPDVPSSCAAVRT